MLTMALVTGAFLVGKMPTTSKANEAMKVLYPRATVITFVDRITDTVICEDSTGEVIYGGTVDDLEGRCK